MIKKYVLSLEIKTPNSRQADDAIEEVYTKFIELMADAGEDFTNKWIVGGILDKDTQVFVRIEDF